MLMNVLTNFSFFTLFLFCFINSQKTFSQEQTITVNQDVKFEQLLNEKRKINSSITINDRYKIQIFNGDSENSKKALADFKRDFKNYDATIVFSTPLYKVWVGNFKTRIESEKALNEFKKNTQMLF